MKKFLFSALSALILFGSNSVQAQSVSCADVTIDLNSIAVDCSNPCGSLSATLPDIRNTDAYIVDTIDFNLHEPFVIPGATGLPVNTDDIWSSKVSLPFPFCFYDAKYTAVCIGSNGVLTFDSTVAGQYCSWTNGTTGPLPNGGYARALIAAVYHDINPAAGTSPVYQYFLTGTAPCRKLIVNFTNIAYFSCTALTATFQLVLYENTNVIDVYIQDKPICSTWNSGAAIVGIQNWARNLATAVPGLNNTQWGTAGYNKAYRFIPNGSQSLLDSVNLTLNGVYVGQGTPVVSGPGELTATFPNICPSSTGGSYKITAFYRPCSGTALTATDSVFLAAPSTVPAPFVISPVIYCLNDPAPPLTAIGVNLMWYTMSVGGVGSPIAPTPNTSVANTTTYYVSQKIDSCESPRALIDVTVIDAPPPVVDSSFISYCAFDSVLAPLSSYITGTNLRWYTVPTGGSGSATEPAINTAVVNTYNYYVSMVSNGCESIRVPITLEIKARPIAPQVTPVTFYCTGETAVAIVATGTNVLFYANPTGGVGNAVAPIPDASVPGVTTYYATQTGTNGCESPRVPVQVNVKQTPPPPLVEEVQLCEKGPALALSANGQSTLYYTVPTGGNPVSIPPIPATDVAGTFNYYVTQTISGCESPRATLPVIVNPQVIADISFAQNPVCIIDKASISFSGQAPTTSTYTWTFDGGIAFSGNGPGPYEVKYNTQGKKLITVTVKNAVCSDSKTSFLTIDVPPFAEFNLQDEACIDEKVTVAAGPSSLEGTAYNWNYDGGNEFYTNNLGISVVQFPTPGVKIITLRMKDGACFSDPVYDTITIRENPIAQITSSLPASICTGDTVLFTAQQHAGYKYEWSPAAYFRNSNTFRILGVLTNLEGTVSVKVTDSLGCTATTEMPIKTEACCTVSIPTAFTPNGDGRNDVFRLITQGHQNISSFVVMNRWGQIVFTTANDRVGWDGTYRGEPQEMESYQYFLRYTCNGRVYEQKGDVTLIR